MLQRTQQIRLCRAINSAIGLPMLAVEGPWRPATLARRSEFAAIANDGARLRGPGSYWIEERVTPLPVQQIDPSVQT